MEKLSLDHLPPGVRFSPKDSEVIELYLKKKIIGNNKDTWFIPEIKFYEDEPWDLPFKSGIATEDQEWFFFTEQSLKHQNDNPKKRKRGQKQELVNRQTKAGFWKSTGPDREIEFGGIVVGMKKTLVFHIGSNKREEKAIRTNWVMHEYRTTQKDFDGKLPGQKAFVLCRLFNNEEKSNKGGPAKSKPALSDVTELVQCNNDNDYDKAYVAENQAAKVDLSEEDIELLMGGFYVPPEDSPSSLPLTTPDVSNPITVRTSHKETQSEPTLAPASQEFPEQAEYHPINCMTRFDNAAPLACNDDYNAYAAENLVAEVNTTEVDLDLDMDKAFEMFYIPPTGPLDCNLFSPSTLTPVTAVSYPTTAEASLEAQSMLAPASVSPELGSEADNYRTSFRCLPEEKYDGITTKTIVPIEYNGYNTYVAKNQVAEVTSDVVEAGSNMFPDTPQPLGCDMLSPLHSHMQADLDANALLFTLEAPELVSLYEIINPEVSSGLLKSGSYLGSLGGS